VIPTCMEPERFEGRPARAYNRDCWLSINTRVFWVIHIGLLPPR
jgi:hypothetical protein